MTGSPRRRRITPVSRQGLRWTACDECGGRRVVRSGRLVCTACRTSRELDDVEKAILDGRRARPIRVGVDAEADNER